MFKNKIGMNCVCEHVPASYKSSINLIIKYKKNKHDLI